MAFTQQTFLGASIRDFRGSLGWGDNPSTLTISVVEDPSNGDNFSPPSIGSPVLFRYDNWTFGGILQDYKRDYSTSGVPIYNIILIDPREILDGVQLILSGYSDSVLGVANLINVYGYHENRDGFGGAEVNGAGIPWGKVKEAVKNISELGQIGNYGGPIALGGYYYSINIEGLPGLPSYFRVPAEHMSLMEFIKFVCDAANYDFFFTLTPSGAGGIINLVTINRNSAPVLGAIDNFIANTQGAVHKNAGYELRNEITSKFLVGGPLSEMYIQANTDEAGGDDQDFDTNPEQNSLWPYWGLDYNNNVIIGNYNGPYHQFNIPTRGLNVFGVGDYYPCDVAELMAAYEGMSSWIEFLNLYNNNKYVNEDFAVYLRMTEPGVDDQQIIREYETDYLLDTTTLVELRDVDNLPLSYRHLGRLNPHFGKYDKFYRNVAGLTGFGLAAKLMGLSTDEAKNLKPEHLSPYHDENISTLTHIKLPGVPEDPNQNVEALFQFIQGYARSYFGQQFMIRLPFLEAAREPEANNIIVSREPVSSGFIDEDDWAEAIDRNILPGNVDRMLDNDYKIKAYVRYNDITNLDLSSIEENNLILSDNGQSAFILCDVQPNIVFLDKDTLYSPRAVITLPGPVFPSFGAYSHHIKGVLSNFLLGELSKSTRKGGALTFDAAQEAIAKIMASPGSSSYNFGSAPLFVVPDIIVLPLQSNIARYGPWYATGAQGKLDFENDNTLTPWTFGGFDEMNNAAQAKVTSSISQYQIHEAGQVEYPGVPEITMGAALVTSGPYVTDINVSIGTEGATTTYTMGTWTPRPFRFSKAQSEYITRVNKKNQELRHQFRTFIRSADKNVNIVSNKISAVMRGLFKSPAHKKSSPHLAIVGNIFQSASGEYKYSIAIDSDYGFASSIRGDGETGGATLDTLFVPFSVNTSKSGIPHFITPSASATPPTVAALNPFTSNGKFGGITDGTSIIRSDGTLEENSSRYNGANPIALRGPLIIAGFGYDINGNPVPTGVTVDEARIRPDLWPCGPLDTRWDADRGVWVTSASSSGTPLSGSSGVLRIIATETQVVTSVSCISGTLSVTYGTVFIVPSGNIEFTVF